MANTAHSSNVDKPIEKVTVAGAREHAAERSADSNKNGGLGSVLGWLTIPGFILLALIVGYFVLSGLKSNTEDGRGSLMQDTIARLA